MPGALVSLPEPLLPLPPPPAAPRPAALQHSARCHSGRPPPPTLPGRVTTHRVASRGGDPRLDTPTVAPGSASGQTCGRTQGPGARGGQHARAPHSLSRSVLAGDTAAPGFPSPEGPRPLMPVLGPEVGCTLCTPEKARQGGAPRSRSRPGSGGLTGEADRGLLLMAASRGHSAPAMGAKIGTW